MKLKPSIYEIDYATDGDNTATLARAYRSEETAMVAARNLADALHTTCVVYRTEKSFGLSVRTRTAVIVNTDKFDWAGRA